MKNKIICAVTGRSYEEIGNGRTEIYSENADIKFSIREKIDKLVRNGVTDFLCHAEYGFPFWAAEYIINLRENRKEQGLSPINLCVIRIYEGQPFAWSYDIQDRYFSVLDDADFERYFSNTLGKDSYRKCEKLMIDCCHFLLTDLRDSFAVQYAELHAKPIVFCEDVLVGV